MSGPTFIEDSDDGEIVQYWSCPMAFITNSAISYWERRCYQEQYPSAPMPVFEQLSPRYAEADRVYNSAYQDTLLHLSKKG